MKRLLLVVAMVLSGVIASSAVRYQGFVESHFGVFVPSGYYKIGAEAGFSTSHGIEIVPGVFLGLGGDLLLGSYYNSPVYDNGSHGIILFNPFIEGRYSILPFKKASPYVGLRLGASLGSLEDSNDNVFPYLTPAIGCSFNLSRKYGLDLGLGYVYYGINKVTKNPDVIYYPQKSFKIANNSIQFRIGFHF